MLFVKLGIIYICTSKSYGKDNLTVTQKKCRNQSMGVKQWPGLN